MRSSNLNLLLGLGGLAAVALLLKRKPAAAKPAAPAVGPTDWAADIGCYSYPLTSAEKDVVRAAAAEAWERRPADRDGAALVTWVASQALSALCPSFPVPAEPYQVQGYKDANGPAWAHAYTVADQWAAGRVMPIPT